MAMYTVLIGQNGRGSKPWSVMDHREDAAYNIAEKMESRNYVNWVVVIDSNRGVVQYSYAKNRTGIRAISKIYDSLARYTLPKE